MAKKWRGPEIVEEIDKALDKGLALFLTQTQSKLSKASPVDTGRLASSWVIGKGAPNREVEPERDGPGPVSVTNQYNDSEITMDSNWFISNNLPYARRAAYDPGYVGRSGGGAGDWFTRIENSLDKDADKAFDFYLRKIK